MACAGNRPGPAATPPRDGVAVLNQMRDAYLGKWFRTVTFVQRTITIRPNAAPDTAIWYEALLTPDRLRIDFASPQSGNGVLYTADSVYVVRNGAVARKIASGNPFLPFVAGVYAQPIETTLRQIAPYTFDLTKLRTDTFEGRPVWVVGTATPGDTTSPQFWIEQERLVIVRMIAAFNPSAPADVGDVTLMDYRPVAGGWLAVRVDITDGDVVQREEYSDWRGNVELPADFFVAEKWSEVPHWATR